MRILAETRNRKHSRELFKLLRENYDVSKKILIIVIKESWNQELILYRYVYSWILRFWVKCAQDVQVIGFYESPADYVSGNLNRYFYALPFLFNYILM